MEADQSQASEPKSKQSSGQLPTPLLPTPLLLNGAIAAMAETYLLNKLKSVEQTFNELNRRLADPDIATDPTEFQRVAKSRSSLEEVVNTYEAWKPPKKNYGARQVLKEAASDPELQEMAALEVEELAANLSS